MRSAWAVLWVGLVVPVLGWAGPQETSGWWVDASSAVAPGAWAVQQALPCSAHEGTLGVAAVVYSRKQGTMAWGHASVRAVGCRDGAPFDHEYETYAVTRGNWPEIERVLAGDPVLEDDPYWRRQRGRIFAFRNDDPVDGGYYADSHARNREIYELWLDVTPAEADRMVEALEARLADQDRRIRARDDLEGRYGALSTNCTLPLQQLLGQDWHLPFRWLRELEGQARLRVLHPSRHLLGRWGGVPERVERRPRPLFRRGGIVPAEAQGPLLPVDGSWPRD
jgi:hypothetical protein